jgi:hypothetical protein
MSSVLGQFLSSSKPETAAAVAAVAAVEGQDEGLCTRIKADVRLPREALAALAGWLDAIGETDPACRADYIAHCAADPERLRHAIQAAADLSREEAA